MPSSIISAIGNVVGSSMAADAQTDAAQSANDAQMGMFNKTQQNLQPFISTGSGSYGDLGKLSGVGTDNPLLSPLLKAPTMTQSQLESTPGYQFNRTQGLKGVQNAAAARGLGSSGAALKGAGAYATGLADSTYQNQFNNAVTNQTNQYNRLLGISNIGENAAAGLGNNAQATGANIGNNLIGAGNAQGAAYVGGATGVGNALQTGHAINSLQDMYSLGQTNNAISNSIAANPSYF